MNTELGSLKDINKNNKVKIKTKRDTEEEIYIDKDEGMDSDAITKFKNCKQCCKVCCNII